MARKAGKRSKSKSGAIPVFLGMTIVLMVVGVLSAAALVKITESRLPQVPSWDEYAARAPKISRIRAADGTVIHEMFRERRTLITPDRLPPLLVNAVLAAEDAEFMKHAGLSYAGIARAMLNNLWQGKISQGGSTITQQVVKQVLLSPERTWKRKFRELLLTRQFEMKLTKKEILAMYMSTLYMGHGRYGFEEASRFYFAKSTADLAVQEAALLAGVVSSPEGNSLLRNQEGAIVRQRYVLERMAALDMITMEQAEAAAAKPLMVWGREEESLGRAPYFVDAVIRELKGLVGADALDTGGMDVATSVDLRMSSAVEGAVGDGLGILYAAGRERIADEAASNLVVDVETGEKLPAPPKSVVAAVDSCRRGEKQAFVSVGGARKVLANESLGRIGRKVDRNLDVVCDEMTKIAVSKGVGEVETVHGKLEEVNAELGPQASFVVLDSKTRAVRAIVGGENFRTRRFNRAIQSKMPIGSTIKPFIYATALAEGIPADREWINESVAYRGFAGKLWKPRNYGGVYDGRAYDMTAALKDSINVIAVKVLKEVGVEKVAATMESFGFKGMIPHDLSMALGSVEASPMELANAYAVFGSGGNYDTPWMIESVTDWQGTVLHKHQARPGRVLAQSIATSMKVMLREVVLDGTAKSLADLEENVWGKTGTTNNSREAWFVGGISGLVGVVLVAYDDRLAMHGATGGNTAVPFFRAFIDRYLHGRL